MRTLYLIRHAAPDVAPGVCYGRLDISVAEHPAVTAERLRPLLPADCTLITSPLSRCRRLAEALGTPEVDARLAEMDFGEWEGRLFDDIAREDIDAWAASPLDFRPPGGETAREMAERVIAALDDLRQRPEADVVVVTHGGPMRVMAAVLLGEWKSEHGAWLARRFGFGEVVRFAVDGHGGVAMRIVAPW
ncbi:alpha-ribazole phosphatase family protein [Uliginosibacterium sp. sgz301328]|uniref:alpha-ribazole phosphatase family protein n=1 Tax=Uliginosibacterium sp. sgz301328 TaxID=3243764 RepID=UPI00359CF56F